MDLDAVRVEFLADVGPFVASVELATQSAKDFRDEVLALEAALDSLPFNRTVHVDTSGWDAQAAAIRAAEQATYDDAAAQEAAKAATDANTASALDNAKAQYMVAMAERMTANTARDQAAATDAATASARRGYGVWGLLTRDFTLWAGVFGNTSLIGKISGWHVALDAVFESAVALGEGLAALSVGVASMVPASQDIYTHLKAVSDVNSALGSQIPPLTGKFDALGQAMAPQTVEAYGGALDLVNRNGHTLATVAGEVVTGIDDWIARLDIWMNSQSSTGKLLQDGVGFLHQFGQAVDNVGLAVDNLIRADPGTAHYLMDFVVLGTKALDVITELPTPLLEAGLALHSFDIWGGLAATQVVKLLNPLRGLAIAMGGVAAEETALKGLSKDAGGLQVLKATLTDVGSGFASWGRNIGTAVSEAEGLSKVGAGFGAAFSFVNPVAAGLAAVAAGAGYVTYEMLQASHASEQFAATANRALTQSSATQFLTQYPQLAAQGLAGLNQALHANERAWVPFHDAISATGDDFKRLIGFNKGLTDGLSGLGGIFRDGGKAIGDFVTGMVHGQQAMNSVSNYTGAITNLDKGQKNLLHDADALISKGKSVADSFALLDLAGVRASDSFAVAQQKLRNLITGYINMSVAGPALMNSVHAITFASEQQNSKIAALTQAWTTFISTVTGGESAFTSFAQQVQGTSALAGNTAATLAASNGKVSLTTRDLSSAADTAKVSITGLSAASLQLRGSFTQAITQGSTLYNSLQTMASAAGLGSHGVAMLTQAGKDMVAELLPMTQHSKAAIAELYALAQQAGYTGSDSFKSLAEWAGKVEHPMKNLDAITTQLTVDSANLATDVKNLAEAIGTNLNQAMAAALLQASGGQKAFDDFATAVRNSHGNASELVPTATKLAAELIAVTGNTQAAHAEFDTFAQAMHLTRQQADGLWSSIRADAAALAALPSHKTVTITTIEQAIGATVPGAGAPGVSAAHHAAGYRVPGYGGGDTVPAWLEPGEAVVPKHLVPAVAPFLGAHHVPGFAQGSIVGGSGGGGGPSGPGMADVAAIWAQELIWRHMKAPRVAHNALGALVSTDFRNLSAVEVPGHLPAGLMMDHAGTGRSGGGGGGGPAISLQPMVIRFELDGGVLTEKMLPHLVAGTNAYNYLNSGQPSGVLNPAG